MQVLRLRSSQRTRATSLRMTLLVGERRLRTATAKANATAKAGSPNARTGNQKTGTSNRRFLRLRSGQALRLRCASLRMTLLVGERGLRTATAKANATARAGSPNARTGNQKTGTSNRRFLRLRSGQALRLRCASLRMTLLFLRPKHQRRLWGYPRLTDSWGLEDFRRRPLQDSATTMLLPGL